VLAKSSAHTGRRRGLRRLARCLAATGNSLKGLATTGLRAIVDDGLGCKDYT
jgi:hypothetical protein